MAIHFGVLDWVKLAEDMHAVDIWKAEEPVEVGL